MILPPCWNLPPFSSRLPTLTVAPDLSLWPISSLLFPSPTASGLISTSFNFNLHCWVKTFTVSVHNVQPQLAFWTHDGIIIAKKFRVQCTFPCANWSQSPSAFMIEGEQELWRCNIQRTGEFLNCLLTEKQTKMSRPKPLVQSVTVGPSSWFRQLWESPALGSWSYGRVQCCPYKPPASVWEADYTATKKSHACVFSHVEQSLGILCYALTCPRWSLAEILERYRYLWKRTYHLWFNPVPFQWGPIRVESDEQYKNQRWNWIQPLSSRTWETREQERSTPTSTRENSGSANSGNPWSLAIRKA